MTSPKILREIIFHETITSIATRSVSQGWTEFDSDFVAATTIEGKLHLIESENPNDSNPALKTQTFPVECTITACALSPTGYATFLIGDSTGRVHRFDPVAASPTESFAVSFDGRHIQHISPTVRRGEITSVTDASSNVYLYDSREMRYLQKIPGKFASGAVGLGDNCVLSATHSSAVYVFDVRRTKSALLKLNTDDLVTCISEPLMGRDGTLLNHSVALGTVGGRCFSLRSARIASGSSAMLPNRCFVPAMRRNRRDLTVVNVVADDVITCGDSAGCFSVIDGRSGALQYLGAETHAVFGEGGEAPEIVTLGGSRFLDKAFATAQVAESGQSVLRITRVG